MYWCCAVEQNVLVELQFKKKKSLYDANIGNFIHKSKDKLHEHINKTKFATCCPALIFIRCDCLLNKSINLFIRYIFIFLILVIPGVRWSKWANLSKIKRTTVLIIVHDWDCKYVSLAPKDHNENITISLCESDRIPLQVNVNGRYYWRWGVHQISNTETVTSMIFNTWHCSAT